MNIKERADAIIAALESVYPYAICSLKYTKPHELLISVRLSAQCTDARVNIVTESLFKKYPTLSSFAECDLSELSEDVKACGFYKTKARNIKDAATMLINKYNGTIPDNIDDLLKIPGVGRKSANLLLGDIYGKPAIVADTHCIRISNRLGFANSQDPYKVELSLKEIIPPQKSSDFCHRLVLFGRQYCTARKPSCDKCPISDLCPKIQ
ncbi:MAG: endonuclease III [Bacillota bacterium]|nr:endonuclease III [Bacillota bacterium]